MKKILLYTTVLLAWTALCSTVTPYYSTNPPVIDGKLDDPCWSQDWIEYEFLKPSKIGRVVVYPAENSLKDYRIEIERNGRFVTVADIKDAQGEAQTHTFTPETTKRMRLFVTANRGPNTRLFEIEVYEK